MSTRTYCVIPHIARENTDFFQGVFEDGVRVLYQGRLQSLLFSHVLSPAHDLIKHINGPLLATLQEGGNATLLLLSPNSEIPNPLPTSKAAAAASSPPCAELAEVAAVAMDLYSHLFPLLFRVVPTCTSAQLSVVTVSATERVLLDNLQDDASLRRLRDARQVTLGRTTSAAEWGTVIRLLEDRHIAVERETNALEGDTACVVTVQLDTGGRLVVVDSGSAQDLLQQLSLALGMHQEAAARTFPLHTPLRDLLLDSVSPHATVQVVCLPAPRDTVRHTMRVLHFGSQLESAREKHVTTQESTKDASFSTSAQEARALTGKGKLFTRPFTSPSVSFVIDPSPMHDVQLSSSPPTSRETSQVEEESPQLLPVPAQPSGTPPVHHSAAPNCTSSISAVSSQQQDRSSVQESTPAQLPPPTVTTAETPRQRARELQLMRRVTSLESTVSELQSALREATAARENAVRARRRSELELSTKTSLWADLQRTQQSSAKENTDYAELVPKLLRQIQTLEHDSTRQKCMAAAKVTKLRTTEEEKDALAEQVGRLRKEVMLFRKDATFRAREATLSRIVPVKGGRGSAVPSCSVSERSEAAARKSKAEGEVEESFVLGEGPGRRRSASATFASSTSGGGGRGNRSRPASPRARRLYDTSINTINRDGRGSSSRLHRSAAESSASPAGGDKSAADPTVQELHWRNRHLQQEVDGLQERLLVALTTLNEMERTSASAAAVVGINGSRERDRAPCDRCVELMEHAAHFEEELAHVRTEKDQLLRLLQSSKQSSGKDTAKPYGRLPPEGALHQKEEDDTDFSDESSTTMSQAREAIAHSSSKGLRHHRSITRTVADALLNGCASVLAQLQAAQSELQPRLRRRSASAASSSASRSHLDSSEDPLSHISSRVLREHEEAVIAFSASVRHIVEKLPKHALVLEDKPGGCTRSSNGTPEGKAKENGGKQRMVEQTLPVVPRLATAADVDVLSQHLTFEVERCRHLRAFIPTFAQLAVATEHLVMRLEATAS